MRKSAICLIMIFALVLSPVTIASARRSNPETTYFRELIRIKRATVADAIHVISRYHGFKGETDIRRELMFLYDSKDIVFRPDILEFAESALSRGDAAVILLKSVAHKGWIMHSVFPDSQRYSMREAKRIGLFPNSARLQDIMSGSELLGILGELTEMKSKKS